MADGDARDVEQTAQAAIRAFPAWSRTPTAERSRLLLDIAARIAAKSEQLARAETIDNGKPIRLARAVDIPRAAANFRSGRTHPKTPDFPGFFADMAMSR